MPEFTLMTYNIKWMNRMFQNGQVKDSKREQAERVSEVISRIRPHILGICEAANQREEHEHFIRQYLNHNYKPIESQNYAPPQVPITLPLTSVLKKQPKQDWS